MKVLKIIGIVVLVIVVAIAIWVMTLSSESHLEREIVINAPVEKVYNVVNDFGQTKEWSPWFKIDPNTKYSYSENLVGPGAWYEWQSDDSNVGNGRQDLLASVENQSVKTSMAFEGMTGEYTADFILEADGDNTKLTWTYDGKSDAMGEKIFMAFTDKFLGPSYEQGLADLKTYIEGLPDPEPVDEVMESDSTMMESDSTVVE